METQTQGRFPGEKKKKKKNVQDRGKPQKKKTWSLPIVAGDRRKGGEKGGKETTIFRCPAKDRNKDAPKAKRVQTTVERGGGWGGVGGGVG